MAPFGVLVYVEAGVLLVPLSFAYFAREADYLIAFFLGPFVKAPS
jgi:hypothetical protein